MTLKRPLLITGLALLAAPRADAFWIDGDGFYGLQGSTETAPAFQKDRGTYQAIQETFRLGGEARFNDQMSAFLEMRLFDDPRSAYLGDTNRPEECRDPATGTYIYGDRCAGQHQSTTQPRYQPYTPKITEAYVRYAFDYCILSAGRRPRQWGLGMFMDAGEKPFDTDASIYDGFDCNVNIQKSQTLGFSVGYDKLSETGSPVDPNWLVGPGGGQGTEPKTADRQFGPNDPFDDLDQYWFSIQYDDRKANAGSFFTKQVGLYFAQITGKPYNSQYDQDPLNRTGYSGTKETGGDGTDIKYVDLYSGFFIGDVAWKNEVLFRMGKSADPSFVNLGGARYFTEGGTAGSAQPATNRVDSIAFAGTFEWTLARSGAPLGPPEFNKGDVSRHVLFLNYAYAPGDADGYRDCEGVCSSTGIVDNAHGNATQNTLIANDRAPKLSMNDNGAAGGRSSTVKAIAFHQNFKPALLLFNAKPGSEDLIVDGAFHPAQMVNASLVAAGYRYESMDVGNFEARLITAQLNEGPPQDVIDWYNAIENSNTDTTNNNYRPPGFYGKSLGYELDLSYLYKVGREAELGGALAAALPGKAWQTNEYTHPSTDFLIQATAVFHF